MLWLQEWWLECHDSLVVILNLLMSWCLPVAILGGLLPLFLLLLLWEVVLVPVIDLELRRIDCWLLVRQLPSVFACLHGLHSEYFDWWGLLLLSGVGVGVQEVVLRLGRATVVAGTARPAILAAVAGIIVIDKYLPAISFLDGQRVPRLRSPRIASPIVSADPSFPVPQPV